VLRRAQEGRKISQVRMVKIRKSMARVLTVVAERTKVRENYRTQLEDEYAERKRQEELAKLKSKRRADVQVCSSRAP
jgi:hypothetical protein